MLAAPWPAWDKWEVKSAGRSGLKNFLHDFDRVFFLPSGCQFPHLYHEDAEEASVTSGSQHAHCRHSPLPPPAQAWHPPPAKPQALSHSSSIFCTPVLSQPAVCRPLSMLSPPCSPGSALHRAQPDRTGCLKEQPEGDSSQVTGSIRRAQSTLLLLNYNMLNYEIF